MNSKFSKSVEEQFRSSQINKVLSGAGEVPQKVAEGLGKASAVIDTTIQTMDESFTQFGRNVQRSSAQQQPPRRQPVNQAQGRPYTPQGRPVPPPRVNPARPAYAGRPVPPPNQFRHGQSAKPVPGPGQRVEEIKKANTVKYWVTAAAAILYAMQGSLSSVGDLGKFAILLVVVYAIAGQIFKDKTRYVLMDEPPAEKKPEKEPEAKKRPGVKTGDPEADAIIDEGYEMLSQITQLGVGIDDESIRQCVSRMTSACTGILEYITAHPRKAMQVRRFMNYYLPTSVKLLETYQRLDRQAVKGENIRTSMEDIDRFMYTVADAFEKQLDSLFSDEAMDISADIAVFETMLKQEGLQGEELRPEPKSRSAGGGQEE